MSARALLRAMFEAAVAAADPQRCLPAHLPAPPAGRVVVIGAGKASASMARALERHWAGALEGTVVTRYGYGMACERIEILEAAHPVPDAAGLRASQRLMERVRGLGPDDLVIALMSGGGSALLAAPLPGLTLEDEQAVNAALLRTGASIAEMNCLRRHLSAIKGGRLAALCHPARVLNLVISDAPGDDPADIASGPTVADPTRCADALEILRRYVPEAPGRVVEVLARGAGESIKPGDPRLRGIETHLIATPRQSLEAAARVCREAGVRPLILGDRIEGEARELGRVMAGIAASCVRQGQPVAPPCCLLSGGETTVTMRGTGRGGRNVEYLLSLALALRGAPGISAIACDTDGVDGSEEVAGAIVTPATLARAQAAGLSARAMLDDNDAHTFFGALGDSVITGPTWTNVNDFRAVLIESGRGVTD